MSSRLHISFALVALFALAGALAGCDSERPLCAEASECASFCEQLGLPIDGAVCADGQCTCRVPEEDAVADLAADADPSTDAVVGTDASADGADLDDTQTSDAETRDRDTLADDAQVTTDGQDGLEDGDSMEPRRCPPDMVDRGEFCIDRYEAPNYEGALPLVMYNFVEAEGWCAARGKRLCFDDEWTSTCEGPAQTAYPYGDAHEPGVCNDEEIWRVYSQTLLSQWPVDLPTTQIDAISALWQTVRSIGPQAAESADHVESLYQAEPAGSNTACTNVHEVYDLTGNVEEWTRRRDGGQPDFNGNLKGRYWAETRTCQSNLTTHGDGFRFYEIGFRCCADISE